MTEQTLEQATSVDAYFDVLSYWLDLESQAERERMARRRQIALAAARRTKR